MSATFLSQKASSAFGLLPAVQASGKKWGYVFVPIDNALKRLAARAGFHVVRNRNNPAHTMMGLGKVKFGAIVDVGANIGQFAREVRKHFPETKMYCFEPVPVALEALAAWAKTQQAVEVIPLALGDEPGQVKMFVHSEHTSSSSLLPTTDQNHSLFPETVRQSEILIAVERLDDWARGKLPPLEADLLLKIDVQGFEVNVLRGGEETLRQVAAVIIEVNIESLYDGQGKFSELVQILDVAGLKYAGNLSQNCAHDGRVVFVDAVFVRSDRIR